MAANVLIIGCGYVGCELARILKIQSKFEVWGLRRSTEKLPDSIQPIVGDLSAPDKLGKWPKCIDYVIYTAAATDRIEGNFRAIYVNGLRNVITRLQMDGYQPKRVLFTSSTDVYHQTNGEVVDESSPTIPNSFAGKLMLEAENILLQSQFPATCVRLGGIYGPDRLCGLINQVKAGKGYPSEPVIYTNRIHRDDCAGILAHLIKHDLNKQPVESVYIGVDHCPSPVHDVMHWLAGQLHIDNLDDNQPIRRSSKRCINKNIVDTGYSFKYSDYKAGYATLIG